MMHHVLTEECESPDWPASAASGMPHQERIEYA